MRLSIKYKATLPVLNVALLGLILGSFSMWFLQKLQEYNQSLSQRFHEIEEVREVEAAITSLPFPLQRYVTKHDPHAKLEFTKTFHHIEHLLNNLGKMSVVNTEEHEMIEYVTESLDTFHEEVDELLTHPQSKNMDMSLRVSELAETHLLPLTTRLNDWHRGEVEQVDQVSADAGTMLSRFIWISILLFILMIAMILVSVWVHSRILIRPLMQVVNGTENLAKGDLAQQISISASDEIGLLANHINEMALKLSQFHKNLERMAVTDQLTGLLNRHALPEIFAKECNRAHHNKTGIAVILMDIDYFKSVNDTYGHPAGDNVLRHVAAVCRTMVREYDFVFRYGGEEFLLLLPVADKNDVAPMAERIRERIARTPWTYETGSIALTASFGAAYFPDDGEDISDVLKKADDALYHAKKSGRNRVSIHPV